MKARGLCVCLCVLVVYNVTCMLSVQTFNFVCGFYFIFSCFLFSLFFALSRLMQCERLSQQYVAFIYQPVSFGCDQFVSNAIFVVRCLSFIQRSILSRVRTHFTKSCYVALIPAFKNSYTGCMQQQQQQQHTFLSMVNMFCL